MLNMYLFTLLWCCEDKYGKLVLNLRTCSGLITKSWPTLAIPWTVACQLLCPWNSPGKNTGVGCHTLFQGIFPTQGLNPGLLSRVRTDSILWPGLFYALALDPDSWLWRRALRDKSKGKMKRSEDSLFQTGAKLMDKTPTRSINPCQN